MGYEGKIKAVISIIAFVLFSIFQSAPALNPGVYFQSEGTWKPMEILRMSGGGATHTAKMLVPGLTPQIVYTYRDAQAPVRLSTKRPTFLFKENQYLVGTAAAVSPRDVVIVKFDKKKDHRELQVTSGGNVLTFKSGFSKDRAFDVSATPQPDGTFSFTPAKDLAPGEYMIITGPAAAYCGYDFGIY